jgi:hypothetical protein
MVLSGWWRRGAQADYKAFDEFKADVELIVSNAMTYNKTGTVVDAALVRSLDCAPIVVHRLLTLAIDTLRWLLRVCVCVCALCVACTGSATGAARRGCEVPTVAAS